jgi:hypothetical protein
VNIVDLVEGAGVRDVYQHLDGNLCLSSTNDSTYQNIEPISIADSKAKLKLALI